MNDDIRKMLDDPYDDSRENSIRSMIGEFYSRRMLSTAVFVWVVAMIVMAGAIFSAVRFFAAEEIKAQILYATLFLTFVHFIALMKVFAWQMIHRNRTAREIKRLEIRIAELSKSLDK
jgi:hypothetical protein